MKEPMADYASSPEPSRPRGRRRLLWIVLLAVLATTLVWEFVLESHVVMVGQGYLNGYGYHLRSLVRLHSLWSTVESRSVVLWRADKAPVFGKYHEVDGHALTGRRSRKRGESFIYALQSDYTLKEIALSQNEAKRVLDLIDGAIKNNSLTPDALWQTRIDPELRLVGSAQDSQPSATSQADEPSDAG
jgi:hypothetical protein